jgi:lipid-binding SYLF domain-containing protein
MITSAAFRPHRLSAVLAVLVAILIAAAPAVVADEKSRLTDEVAESRGEFLKKDPSLEKEMAGASGYALFPGVGKGGIGVGGARGTGQVIVGGTPVARATLTQVNIGFQLGGQKYAELILLQNKEALDSFLSGTFTFAAQASAVAVASGAAANAKYSGGVKVITMPIGGLMYEASVGGQKFGIQRY